MRRLYHFFAALFLLSHTFSSLSALVWTPAEMIKVNAVKDIQISPDNTTAVFVVTSAKRRGDKDKLISQLYKKSLNGDQKVTPLIQMEGSCVQPQWSPDGKWIAYLAESSGIYDLCIINSTHGEAIALTKAPRGIQTFLWSPDSRRIAFVMADDKRTAAPRLGKKWVQACDLQFEVLSSNVQRGAQITNHKPDSNFFPASPRPKNEAITFEHDLVVNRLWVIDIIAGSQPKALTPDEFYVRGKGDFGSTNIEFDWSPDGKAITFSYSPASGWEYYHTDSSIASVDILKERIVRWEKKAQHESMPRYSPNGKWIAYLESDTPTGWLMDRQVAVHATDSSLYRPLASTYNAGSFLSGASLLGWDSDGERILIFEPKGTKYHLQFVPLDGSPAQEIVTGDWFFNYPALSPDRTMVSFAGQSPSKAPEAYVAKLDDFQPICISQLDQAYEKYPTSRTEAIKWRSVDGKEIEGLLTYPVNYEAGKRYPLLLVIHGGPAGFFSENYLGGISAYPLASFAEEGFVILRANPRGSTGYGKAFRQANLLDWGGKDYFDLMAGVDAVIAQGVADGDRLGVMGWSYGGYMTAWIITQTSRFKAASVGAAPTNLTSMYGTTDVPGLLEYYMGDFAANFELYKSRSPIYHVDRVSTPCLIQHGLDDERVPIGQANELYRALKRKQKEAVLVLYPRTAHGITDPVIGIELMEENLAWFKEHLQKH